MKRRSMNTLTIAALVVAVPLVLVLALRGDEPEKLTLSAQQWHEDLQFLARTLPEKHANAFHYTSKEKFEAAVSELDKQLDHIDSDAGWVGMARIVALVGDAHTYLKTPQDEAGFPITFSRFGNDYRVVGVSPGLEQALGARVVKVEDMPVARAAELVYQMFSQDENPELSESFIAQGLTIGSYLHGLGITPNRNVAHYTLRGDDNREFTIESHAPQAGESAPKTIWAFKSRPISRQNPGQSFYCNYLSDAKTLYCNVRAMRDLKDAEKEMLKLIEQHKPDRLALDLRQNSGGDYNEGLKYLVEPIRGLPNINKKGHLFVLIGPGTFSAAMNNATHFRYQTQALLVGRTIGEKPNEYAEPRSFTLPNSHLTVRYSTRYYKFVENGENAVHPDQDIIGTWEDFVSGRDAALEWVLSYHGT